MRLLTTPKAQTPTSSKVKLLVVVVKGTLAQAIEAAQLRDVPVLRPIAGRVGTSNEVIIHVPAEAHDKVVAWFCEPTAVIKGFGYPTGTCLFYNEAREGYVP